MKTTTLRQAFEAIQVKGKISPLARRILKRMELGAGIVQPKKQQQRHKQGPVRPVREHRQPSAV